MNLHEYQAKNLLRRYHVPVPAGVVVFTPEEAVDAANTLGGARWVVKAQVHAGGRGKAGGVKLVDTKEAVREAAKFYKTPSTDIVVIHDDLDLAAGRLRLRERGGSGGHRGIESMLVELGTDEFVRVRFGVGRPPAGWDSADYVLGKFDAGEQELIRVAVVKAAVAVEAILKEGAAPAMNRFNRLD